MIRLAGAAGTVLALLLCLSSSCAKDQWLTCAETGRAAQDELDPEAIGQWQLDITIKGRRIRKLVGDNTEVANVVLDEYRRRRTLAHHGLPVWIGGSALPLGE